MFFKKGKILKIKTGYNPNSSSIGTDLTPLLIGGTIISLLIPVITIIVSRKLKGKPEMTQEYEEPSPSDVNES